MEDIHKIILLVKEYIQKQKEEFSLTAVEGLIKILSAAIIGIVVLSITCIIILLCSIAFSMWISQTYFSNSYHIGFAITSAILLVLILILWFKRNSWVVQPVARIIVKQLLDDTTSDNTNNSTTDDNGTGNSK